MIQENQYKNQPPKASYQLEIIRGMGVYFKCGGPGDHCSPLPILQALLTLVSWKMKLAEVANPRWLFDPSLTLGLPMPPGLSVEKVCYNLRYLET